MSPGSDYSRFAPLFRLRFGSPLIIIVRALLAAFTPPVAVAMALLLGVITPLGIPVVAARTWNVSVAAAPTSRLLMVQVIGSPPSL